MTKFICNIKIKETPIFSIKKSTIIYSLEKREDMVNQAMVIENMIIIRKDTFCCCKNFYIL